MPDQMPPAKESDVPRYRICRHPQCTRAAKRSHGYCKGHASSPEARDFLAELKSAVSILELVPPPPDAKPSKRHRFERRIIKGEFNTLLDGSMSAIIHEADKASELAREIGANRFAIARSLTLEDDPHAMALSIVRASNTIARLVETRYALNQRKSSTKPAWPSARHGEFPK